VRCLRHCQRLHRAPARHKQALNPVPSAKPATKRFYWEPRYNRNDHATFVEVQDK
jgi:hypothetical protein